MIIDELGVKGNGVEKKSRAKNVTMFVYCSIHTRMDYNKK